VLQQFREAQDFSNVDDAWFECLVRGVSEISDELVGELSPFMDRAFDSLDTIEQVILKMAAWELRNAPELPTPIILNEAVDLARRFGAEQGHSFVNAVLDRAARQWRPAEVGGAAVPASDDAG
jgi:N utilization substance protein B